MRFIYILFIGLALFSCEKENFTTVPQIKYKSVNSTNISGDQLLQFKFTMTDKEGDFDRFLGIKKTVKNCPDSDFMDTIQFTIPDDFLQSKRTEGELVVSFSQINRGANKCPDSDPSKYKTDTAVYSFWIRDKAGNKSDTAYSEPIILNN